jgi:prolyl 4-hydroxylase
MTTMMAPDTMIPVVALRRSALAGDVHAMTELGAILMSGRGVAAEPDEGAAMLHRAIAQGSAEAAAIAAQLACIGGDFSTQAWARGLDYLQLAAERGSERARGQLMVLSADRERAAAVKAGQAIPHAWRRLRDGVDLAGLAALPPDHAPVTNAPYIALIERLLPPEVCDWLVACGKPRLVRASTYNTKGPGSVYDVRRTNSSAEFDVISTDLVLMLVQKRVAAAARVDIGQLESTIILNYAPGQQFEPHYDFLDPANPVYADELVNVGQRTVTLLVYLNEDYTAGETEFTRIGMRYRGHKGDAITFHNLLANGAPDYMTMHAGLAPGEGEKWLLSAWFRRKIAPERLRG